MSNEDDEIRSTGWSLLLLLSGGLLFSCQGPGLEGHLTRERNSEAKCVGIIPVCSSSKIRNHCTRNLITILMKTDVKHNDETLQRTNLQRTIRRGEQCGKFMANDEK